MNDSENKEESKEDFCPVCIAVPLAMAGAGMTGVGVTQDKSNHTYKIFTIIGIASTILSLFAIWYYWRCKDCR